MELDMQRRLAAKILKCGINKIYFDPSRLKEIKEAITKSDIRSLIKDKAIARRPRLEKSRSRSRILIKQKRKGRRKGPGSRKGKHTARLPGKLEWMNLIRHQRGYLKQLKQKNMIPKKTFRQIYRMMKGGFFRSKRHLQLYLEEHNLLKK